MVNKRRFQSLSYRAVEAWGGCYSLLSSASFYFYFSSFKTALPEEYVLHFLFFFFFSFLPVFLLSKCFSRHMVAAKSVNWSLLLLPEKAVKG